MFECAHAGPEGGWVRRTCLLCALSVLALIATLTNCPAGGYDPGPPFDKYKVYAHLTEDCGQHTFGENNLSDKGPIAWSCRRTLLTHIRGWGRQTIRKFVALACARGPNDVQARVNADGWATVLLNRMKADDLRMQEVPRESGYTYVNDEEDTHCVKIGAHDPPLENEVHNFRLYTNKQTGDRFEEKMALMEAEDAAQEENERAEREAAARRALLERQRRELEARSLTIEMQSLDRYRLQLEFYSQNYSRAWPGGGKIFPLGDSQFHTFRLNCQPGEKICYGAWRDGSPNGRYWGSGYNGRQTCATCCMICGRGSRRITLNAGPEDSPSGGGGSSVSVSDMVDMLNAGVALGTAIHGMRGGGSGGGYVPPPPRMPSGHQNNSDSQVTGRASPSLY